VSDKSPRNDDMKLTIAHSAWRIGRATGAAIFTDLRNRTRTQMTRQCVIAAETDLKNAAHYPAFRVTRNNTESGAEWQVFIGVLGIVW
jgi:hypothetical protein